MRNFAVLTDSCCDLDKDTRVRLNISYLAMNITYNDKELPASLDWDLYSPKELYDVMRGGTRVMTTQVPVETFMDGFKKELDAGNDILYIGCSSALSGSVNTSFVVRDELKARYPDAKIICIDARNSCLGEGMMAICAAEMRDEGKTIDEIADYIETNKQRFNQVGTVESLEYLKRAGRVTAPSAFFGNIFGVKPILISDTKGQNVPIKKVKGRRTSLLEIVDYIKQTIEQPEEQTIYLAHADCEVDAEFIKEHILKEIPCKGVYTNFIGPIIGASVGPGTIIVYYLGKEITI